MKKYILASLLIVCLSWCTRYQQVEYKGVTLEYPSDLTISYNDFDLFWWENIDIQVTHTGSFMFDCAEVEVERGSLIKEYKKTIWEVMKKYQEALEYLRDTGYINSVMSQMESLTCGFAGRNLSIKPIKIDGINWVIINKVTWNSGLPSLSTFFKQVILVWPWNQVYSLIFNYEFWELGKYINSIKDEYGEAILEDSQEHKYVQVVNYFAHWNPLNDGSVIDFEENDKMLEKIINTIKIQK